MKKCKKLQKFHLLENFPFLRLSTLEKPALLPLISHSIFSMKSNVSIQCFCALDGIQDQNMAILGHVLCLCRVQCSCALDTCQIRAKRKFSDISCGRLVLHLLNSPIQFPFYRPPQHMTRYAPGELQLKSKCSTLSSGLPQSTYLISFNLPIFTSSLISLLTTVNSHPLNKGWFTFTRYEECF